MKKERVHLMIEKTPKSVRASGIIDLAMHIYAVHKRQGRISRSAFIASLILLEGDAVKAQREALLINQEHKEKYRGK